MATRVDTARELLEVERPRVERALARAANELLADAPAAVAEPIRYALEGGGKRLRPVLCIAAYRAVREDSNGGAARAPGMENGAADAAKHAEADRGVSDSAAPPGIYWIAGGIELIHTYSLIHDDLPCMDDDELRRGRPTVHKVFGDARAAACGAALIPLACRAVAAGGERLGLDTRVRMELVGELMCAAGGGGMVGGQVLDLEAEGNRVDATRLAAIHGRKTAALVAASLKIGGRAAGASAASVVALESFGRAVGLAFQIRDDILDVTGTDAALGKTAGKDMAAAKATYPAMLGVAGAGRQAKENAARAISALEGAGIESPELNALAYYTIERRR